MTTSHPVRIEIADRVGLITIDRPEARNALDVPTLEALDRARADLEADESVGAIVVTGAGNKAFVAGADIADMSRRRGLAHYRDFAELNHGVFSRLERCDKPTVAAVNGWALGGGAELLLCLDIRLLAHTARIGLPEIGLGLFPGAGGSQRLIRQVPLCRAKEIMFLGEPLDAAEAVALGIANRVVAADTLLHEALALGRKLAAQPPVALKLLKRAMIEGAAMPPEAALAHERALISLVFDSDDAHEGMGAFLEKRPPAFAGR